MKLEIVSHCWRYSRLLTYQFSSLVLFPPREVEVTMTVFLTPEDRATVDVLRYFAEGDHAANVHFRAWSLARPWLVRREVGRDLAARQTQADWIWFTDCDHLFRENALDALPDRVANIDAPLVFPRLVMKSRSPQAGDAAIARAGGEPRVLDIAPEQFEPVPYHCAIGGVQIARGEVTRRLGYSGTPLARARGARRWQRARGDPLFRRRLGTAGTPIDLPNVFRIRHSKCGRVDVGVQL